MKWSFLASLLTSAAVLAPISASAKAETFSPERVSANIFSGRLLASKSSALGINKKKDGGDSQQVVQTEGQGTGLSMDTLGRGGTEAGKAKSPDTLQLSRGLGSGAEGGGSPSQHAPVVKTKDMSLPGRPMLANQQATQNGAPIDGEKGPSLGSTSSRSADSTFVMPTPVALTVGQDHQTGGGISTASPSRGASYHPQSQDITSPSSSQGSEGSLGESHSSSIELGGSGGGGGGGGSSSQEGTVLPPEAVQEYRELRAKVKNIPPIPSKPIPFIAKKERAAEHDLSPKSLEQARMGLKNVEQTKSVNQSGESTLKEDASKSSAEKNATKTGQSQVSGSGVKYSGPPLSENIFRAAEFLGFDLGANYKDEADAKKALARLVFTKDKELNADLAKTDPEKEPVKYQKLYNALMEFETYKTTVAGYIEAKYDKRNPNEEEIKAAEFLGFDLGTNYKDEADAKKALTRLVFNKDKELNADLAKVDPAKDPVKYEKLYSELMEFDARQVVLKKYLTRRYMRDNTASSSIRERLKTQSSVKGGGANDPSAMFAQLQSFGGSGSTAKRTPVKKLTPAEIKKEKEKEIGQLAKELIDLEKQQREFLLAGQFSKAKQAKEKEEALRKKKTESQNLLQTLNAQQRGGTKSVQVSGERALEKEKEEMRLVEEFKSSHHDIAPFMNLLLAKDQKNFLKATVNVQYTPDEVGNLTFTASKSKIANNAAEIPLVGLLSHLTPEQRSSLLKAVESRKEENAGSQSANRLSVVKRPESYRDIGFQLPPTFAEAMKRFPPPVVEHKKEEKPLTETQLKQKLGKAASLLNFLPQESRSKLGSMEWLVGLDDAQVMLLKIRLQEKGPGAGRFDLLKEAKLQKEVEEEKGKPVRKPPPPTAQPKQGKPVSEKERLSEIQNLQRRILKGKGVGIDDDVDGIK